MVLWHDEEDTPRSPREVGAGEAVGLWIGTYPIEHGQSLAVDWQVKRPDGNTASGSVEAEWQHNDLEKSNSYWMANIGPFEEGDQVQYTVRGQSVDGPAGPLNHAFAVGPQKVTAQ